MKKVKNKREYKGSYFIFSHYIKYHQDIIAYYPSLIRRGTRKMRNRYQLKQIHWRRIYALITKMLDAKIFVSRERHRASSRKCTGIKVQRGLLTLALSEKFAGLYLPRAARFDPVFPYVP